MGDRRGGVCSAREGLIEYWELQPAVRLTPEGLHAVLLLPEEGTIDGGDGPRAFRASSRGLQAARRPVRAARPLRPRDRPGPQPRPDDPLAEHHRRQPRPGVRSAGGTVSHAPALAAARPSELEEAIRVGGLARAKAKAILGALARIREERGGYSLDFLRGCRFPRRGCTSPRSRGRREDGEHPAPVLLRHARLPVDTHVLRVTKRLGLVPATSDLAKAALSLEPHVGPGTMDRCTSTSSVSGGRCAGPAIRAARNAPLGSMPGGETKEEGAPRSRTKYAPRVPRSVRLEGHATEGPAESPRRRSRRKGRIA